MKAPKAVRSLSAVLFASILFGACHMAHGESGENKSLKNCFGPNKDVTQPFKLEELVLQWDEWTTSRLTTAAAAIILSEKMGFNIKLRRGSTSKEMYAAISRGEIHLAFEAWPNSNLKEFKQYTGTVTNGSIETFPYNTLFGRAGIFETCSRRQTDNVFSKCADNRNQLEESEPILRLAICLNRQCTRMQQPNSCMRVHCLI